MVGNRLQIAGSSFLFIILALSASWSAWGQSDDHTKLIEAAKMERRLVWYTSTNVSEAKPLLEDFEKQYPFIKTEFLRASTEKILNRIITETRAGKWNFDVVLLSEFDVLMEQKLVRPYHSPEASNFRPEFKDPNGYWTAVYNAYYVIGYNNEQVSEKEAPKTWEDLLDSKWRGKISIDREEYPWYTTLTKAWGKAKTQKYMRALSKQNIQWRKGHTLIAQLMAAGEFPLAIVYAHRIESMKKSGAPVEWVNTVDPVIASLNSVGLSAKPHHPNTGKLFIDFLLSKNAQEKIRSFDRIPARSDVDPLSPKMDQSKLKLMPVPSEARAQFNEHIKEFRKIFGL